MLGLTDKVLAALETDHPQDELDACLWNACRRGNPSWRVLIDHGADVDWHAPWSNETPADIARSARQDHLLPWLATRAGQ